MNVSFREKKPKQTNLQFDKAKNCENPNEMEPRLVLLLTTSYVLISNFLESDTSERKQKKSASKSVPNGIVEFTDEDIAGRQNLTKPCPLPKSITDEFPGGVINIGVYACDGRIVDPIYPVVPLATSFE